jgi:hypothetical protein
MNIEVTTENLLVQLGYPAKDATVSQMERIVANTKNFDKFAKHIISLNDELKRFNAIVAMSNSNDYLKIKCDSKEEEEIAAFEDIVKHWSEKYKIELQKVDGKHTYYILGQN